MLKMCTHTALVVLASPFAILFMFTCNIVHSLSAIFTILLWLLFYRCNICSIQVICVALHLNDCKFSEWVSEIVFNCSTRHYDDDEDDKMKCKNFHAMHNSRARTHARTHSKHSGGTATMLCVCVCVSCWIKVNVHLWFCCSIKLTAAICVCECLWVWRRINFTR